MNSIMLISGIAVTLNLWQTSLVLYKHSPKNKPSTKALETLLDNFPWKHLEQFVTTACVASMSFRGKCIYRLNFGVKKKKEKKYYISKRKIKPGTILPTKHLTTVQD